MIMSGSSLVYKFQERPWLYGEILTPVVMVLTVLILPLLIAALKSLVEDHHLKNVREFYYESFIGFFFLNSVIPRSIPAKIVEFSYSAFILIFLSFYLGNLTEEYLSYKSFEGIFSKDDVIGKKVVTNIALKYNLLSIGGNRLFNFSFLSSNPSDLRAC